MAESRQMAAEDSRWPNRKAVQTRNGVHRNVQGSPFTLDGKNTPKIVQAAALSDPRQTPPSTNWRFVNFKDRVAPQSSTKGVNINAPAASPSHQVRQMRPNCFHGAKPPSARLVTPNVAATAVLRTPAKRAKRRMSQDRSKACFPLAKRKTRTEARTASSVLPVATPAEVSTDPAVVRLTAKAPRKIAGQKRKPRASNAAIARPVGGQTGEELGCTVAR